MFPSDSQHTIKAFIRRGEAHYVAECLEVAVVTQGKTLDETITNLQEAVALHLGYEAPADFGLAPTPPNHNEARAGCPCRPT